MIEFLSKNKQTKKVVTAEKSSLVTNTIFYPIKGELCLKVKGASLGFSQDGTKMFPKLQKEMRASPGVL